MIGWFKPKEEQGSANMNLENLLFSCIRDFIIYNLSMSKMTQNFKKFVIYVNFGFAKEKSQMIWFLQP